MTDETKKLFDAPWEVGVCEKGNPEFEAIFIASKTGCLIGRDMEEETANRLARLPELYDALLQAVKNECTQFISLDACDLCSGCPAKRWSKLLRQVRDGQ